MRYSGVVLYGMPKTLGDEIRALQIGASVESWNRLQKVLDIMSARGKAASAMAKDKSRGDSEYYSKLAKKRWK